MRNQSMRAAMSICVLLLFGTSGVSQLVNATLTGTVSDASAALIPGVEISATHTGTYKNRQSESGGSDSTRVLTTGGGGL